MLASVTDSLVTFATDFVKSGGLPAIFVLMTLESACIPIPSEATMLFAGFAVADAAATGGHHLTLIGIVAAGVLGNLIGSWIAYAVGYFGRIELLEKHGRVLHIKPTQLRRADSWFARYGDPSIFFSRMLPVIRTFISLPAGVARMPFWRFTTLTVLGCIPWVLALALIGKAVRSQWVDWKNNLAYVDYLIVAAVLLALAYAVVQWRRRRAAAPNGVA
ncbi:MAG TPA: DedA family protein [Solirubrobacteraceae bacterium]|nr:DedA family protein [Solirubrobacteraceae bacterium]